MSPQPEPPPDMSWVEFEHVSDVGPLFALLMFGLTAAMVAVIVILELS